MENVFNKHFANTADKYLRTPHCATDHTDLNQTKMPPGNTFCISPISQQFVHDLLFKMDFNKAVGLDDVYTSIRRH